jgi:uncharacterized protein YmfQ (DUF2313 family)
MSEMPPVTGLSPELVALCGIPVEELRDNLLDLLPVGPVWPRDPDTTLARFWLAIADSLVVLRGRDCDLLAESYPCGSTELLPDWERVCGLPDECTEGTWPLASRRAFVCAKLAEQGGATPAYFIALAASYGFTIVIKEHWPWVMGTAPLCTATIGIPWFWWEVVCPDLPVAHVTVGCWQLGEPLCVIQGAALLECVIRRAAPAHTLLTFRYTITHGAWDAAPWDHQAWS